MKERTGNEWDKIFNNPSTDGSTRKILLVDVYRAQQTDQKAIAK